MSYSFKTVVKWKETCKDSPKTPVKRKRLGIKESSSSSDNSTSIKYDGKTDTESLVSNKEDLNNDSEPDINIEVHKFYLVNVWKT